jgi:predicted glycogen debranching enzyme
LRLPDGRDFLFGAEEHISGQLDLHGVDYLDEFQLESGLPAWRYRVGGIAFEKRVFLPYKQNTVLIRYQLVAGTETVRLELRPACHFRSHDGPVKGPDAATYILTASDHRVELADRSGLPPLRLCFDGDNSAFTTDGRVQPNILYRFEASVGYDHAGSLWSPGYFRADLRPGRHVTLVASTEAWDTISTLAPAQAFEAERARRERLIARADPRVQQGPARELVLAADQFLITPAGRAAGDEVRTVIAGYHWFTDWGRDTMISLEGLTLTTGRHTEAGYLLRTFAHYIRDGLIPNLFPEGEKEGLYHTADATLWFFHALKRYLDCTHDRMTLRLLLPQLHDIVAHHLRGTHFGIHVDPRDGLLIQGQEGFQLTWMDAKVGDWVVTPRRGKAVEINALWYNALCLLEGWTRDEQGPEAARPLADHAERTRRSFNERFWYAKGGYLYDVVDGENGDDPALRPNQVLAISLDHPVLVPERWRPVLDVVREQLSTPVGLRSLAPSHPDYKPQYYGDLRARDTAYHQGTVWAWLIGPFIDAWLKVQPEDREARRFLEGLVAHLGEACVGSISEVFDAEPPFTPRGCIAQAWSVAEVLRCWAKTVRE